MKKIILALGLFLWLMGTASADFGYPFETIAKPSCRKEAWDTLTSECKIPLPKIVGADYTKYSTDMNLRRIYTVLWGATYDYGWDIWYGSHIGVDIATSAGTPVLSIAEGTVIAAAKSPGWGNYITVRHTLSDKTEIFSNYAHLSELLVSKGDRVSKWQNIGKVGNTGNSYGNHLHFQIDTTDQLHPYYYVTCGKGKNPMTIVNTGDCRSFLEKNTLDPILFLETGNLSTITPTASTIEKIIEKQESPTALKIEKTKIKSRAEIIEEDITEYLRKYEIDIGIPSTGIMLNLGEYIELPISVRTRGGGLVDLSLPEPGVEILFDPKMVNIFPEKIIFLENGVRSFRISPLKTGSSTLSFRLGKRIIATSRIFVGKRWEKIEPKSVEVRTSKKVFLAEESVFYVSPIAPSGSLLLDRPYKTRFVIQVLQGKAKFCNTSRKDLKTCDPTELVSQLEFGYEDTRRGFLEGRLVALESGKIEFSVRKIGEKTPLPGSKKIVQVRHPVRLSAITPYYESIMLGLRNGWWKTDRGYTGEHLELTGVNVRELTLRVLTFKMLRSGTDSVVKKQWMRKIVEYRLSSKNMSSELWTRGAFASHLLDALGIPKTLWVSVWNDESGAYQSTIHTLRTRYRFEWQDGFPTYFQSETRIKLGEALYLIERVVGR